ncbi:MAG: hypothetical protein QGE94_05110 [Desulfobacterales bacterium]|jgi:hypothetical protein|nr:hypothetical protein [Desulfobacterales bacterium]
MCFSPETGIFQCRIADSRILKPTRIRKIDGLWIAESYTLRVSIAQIAFKNLLIPGIESHGPEGAGRHADFAADAPIVINHDTIQPGVPLDGFTGTGGHARCIFALLTAYRNKYALISPMDNADS